MDKQEATKKIAEFVQQAYTALREAEALADEYGVEFSFEPAYGMGGWYTPEGYDDSSSETGWMASSQSC